MRNIVLCCCSSRTSDVRSQEISIHVIVMLSVSGQPGCSEYRQCDILSPSLSPGRLPRTASPSYNYLNVKKLTNPLPDVNPKLILSADVLRFLQKVFGGGSVPWEYLDLGYSKHRRLATVQMRAIIASHRRLITNQGFCLGSLCSVVRL